MQREERIRQWEQSVPNQGKFDGLMDLAIPEAGHSQKGEQRLAAALAEEKSRVQSILSAVTDGVIPVDAQGRILAFNLAAERMFGYDAHEIVGKKLDCLLVPVAPGRMPQSTASCLDSLSAWNPEMTGFRKNGSTFPLEIGFNDVTWDNQRIILVTARDLSRQKQAEQDLARAHDQLESRVHQRTSELRATTARLSSLISKLNAGVLVENEGGKIILVNEAFCRLFNVTDPPESLRGQDSDHLIQEIGDLSLHPKAFYSRLIAILSNRQPVTGEEIALRNGRFFERDHMPILIEDEDYGHFWVYREITAQKAAFIELQRARESAEARLQAQTEFLARLRRKLQPPVESLLETIQDALMTKNGVEQTHQLRCALASTQTLHSLLAEAAMSEDPAFIAEDLV